MSIPPKKQDIHPGSLTARPCKNDFLFATPFPIQQVLDHEAGYQSLGKFILLVSGIKYLEAIDIVLLTSPSKPSMVYLKHIWSANPKYLCEK